MINLHGVLSLQEKNIADWHKEISLTQTEPVWIAIEENNMWNFLLWHEEDVARIKDIDPARMVEAKRNIDKYNQYRNNAIEKIDECFLSYLESRQYDAINSMHSETPGMMIDRLSIMSLKRYHMHDETLRADASAEHKTACAQKVLVLDEQIADLAECLSNVISLLETGKLKFKVYRQFKMYNDPALNPQLYKKLIN